MKHLIGDNSNCLLLGELQIFNTSWPLPGFLHGTSPSKTTAFNDKANLPGASFSLSNMTSSGGKGATSTVRHWKVVSSSFQWLFLVPLKGGRWHIIPGLAVYTTYIPLIYCLVGGYMLPTTLYRNLKNPLIFKKFLLYLYMNCQKKLYYIPLYWLVNRNLCIGLMYSTYNWVVYHSNNLCFSILISCQWVPNTPLLLFHEDYD